MSEPESLPLNEAMAKGEIGPALTVEQLRRHQIVVLAPDSIMDMLTLRVEAIGSAAVSFYSQPLRTRVLFFRREDGTLVDGNNRVVRMFEYRGT